MYIRRVQLENIRCFEHIDIDFTSKKDVRKWNVILGDNGVGKTTLLRSIAMGLGDETSAAALLRELYGEWIRLQAGKRAKATIYIELTPIKRSGRSPWIRTTIERTPSGYSRVHQDTSPKEFPWGDVFICGFGAARRAFATKDYDEYSSIDAVYTLFNYDSPLQTPELVMRRLEHIGIERRKILSWIDNILLLPQESTDLGKSGIAVRGPWGKFVALGGLGDGYHATLAWIMDMLGWALLYEDDMLKRHIAGIVLLDEIEQHLHPSWQRHIIRLLRDQFPKIQFIATTHTPLSAIGMTDLKDEECQLVLLLPEDDRVEALDRRRPPRGQRADQVLTSYLFGLPTAGDLATHDHIERYSQLMGKRRTGEEEREVRLIHKVLEKTLGTKETELEREVARAVKQVLRKRPVMAKFKNKVVDYEVKRQIRQLMERVPQ